MELTVLGAVLCACIYFFICRSMDYSVKKDILLMRKSVFFLRYVGILIVEIVKSSMQVLQLVLTDREIAEPVIISYKTRLKTDLGRAILANSITLTPGTITISLEEDELIIHCLDKTMAEGFENLVFEELLEKMEA